MVNIRKETIRNLMIEYRNLSDNHPNKNELKKSLLAEMDLNYPQRETEHIINNESIFEEWIDYELMQKEVEGIQTRFNLDKVEYPKEEYSFPIKIN